MSLRMIQPSVHPRSRFYWFRRRVPTRYRAYGMPAEVKFSLETADYDEAVLLCQEHNLRLEREWRSNIVGVLPNDLSHLQIVALAGDFYREMVATHRDEPGAPSTWEAVLKDLERRKRPPAGLPMHQGFLYFSFSQEARRFLAPRGIHLVGDRFLAFLRAYIAAKAEAAQELRKNAEGDYTPNKAVEKKYPKFEQPDPKHDFDELWKHFCKAKKLSAGSKKKWEPYFRMLITRVRTSDMSRVTQQHLVDWRDDLLATDLSAITVRDGYIAAAKSFFGWCHRATKLPTNPCEKVVVEISEGHAADMRGFTDAEAALILSASLAPMSPLMTAENRAARRWVPWLCAYTGARVNEMTQLRACDVHTFDGIPCIHIRPDAGSVKTSRARSVPIHSHLIEQDFLEFAGRKRGDAPLFYSIERQRKPDRKNPTYASVGNKLAEWVRGLGIKDETVAPNHGWRHRFKTVARKVDMNPETRDAIQGHKPRTEGENYGVVDPDVMRPEIERLPRYEVEPGELRDKRKRSSR